MARHEQLKRTFADVGWLCDGCGLATVGEMGVGEERCGKTELGIRSGAEEEEKMVVRKGEKLLVEAAVEHMVVGRRWGQRSKKRFGEGG